MDKLNNKPFFIAAASTACLMMCSAAAGIAFIVGCTSTAIEDGEWRDYIESHVAALTNRLATASATLESPVAQGEVAGGEGPAAGTDAVSFADLRWCYGGFNGAGAERVSGCEIADLKISGNGMSYRWADGDCGPLGAPNRGDAICIAALFVQGADGEWKGGKFEWIGTSRTTRSFSNIEGEYHGWPSDSIKTARGYAFCIVSKDGKKRSNVIVAEDR